MVGEGEMVSLTGFALVRWSSMGRSSPFSSSVSFETAFSALWIALLQAGEMAVCCAESGREAKVGSGRGDGLGAGQRS